MHSAIIHCTSCLSVTTLKEKNIPAPGAQGGYWDDAGKEGSETGCESISTAQPEEGLACPKWYFCRPGVRKEDLVLLKRHLYFLWCDAAAMLMDTRLMLVILGLNIDLLAFSVLPGLARVNVWINSQADSAQVSPTEWSLRYLLMVPVESSAVWQ